MSHAARNSLILLTVILVGFSVGAYLVFGVRAETLRSLREQDETTREELEELKGRMEDFQRVDERFLEAEMAWKSRSKVIARQEDPTITYRDLIRLLELGPGGLDFDFTLIEEGTEGDLHFNLYQLIGQGEYQAIHNFVRFLEHDVLFRRIESLELERVTGPDAAQGSLQIRMFIRCYSDSDATEEIPSADLPAIQETRSPFEPYRPPRRRRPPANVNGLPEVSGAELLAVTDRGIILRERSGRIHRLNLGDPVYLGRLAAVDPATSSCRFDLNRLGATSSTTLRIQRARDGGTP